MAPRRSARLAQNKVVDLTSPSSQTKGDEEQSNSYDASSAESRTLPKDREQLFRELLSYADHQLECLRIAESNGGSVDIELLKKIARAMKDVALDLQSSEDACPDEASVDSDSSTSTSESADDKASIHNEEAAFADEKTNEEGSGRPSEDSERRAPDSSPPETLPNTPEGSSPAREDISDVSDEDSSLSDISAMTEEASPLFDHSKATRAKDPPAQSPLRSPELEPAPRRMSDSPLSDLSFSWQTMASSPEHNPPASARNKGPEGTGKSSPPAFARQAHSPLFDEKDDIHLPGTSRKQPQKPPSPNDEAGKENAPSGFGSTSEKSPFKPTPTPRKSKPPAAPFTPAPTRTNNKPSTKTAKTRITTTEKAKLADDVLRANESGRGSRYRVLNLPANASDADITQAFRKVVLKLHPDKNKAENASEAFRAAKAAYDVLRSPTQRTAYDRDNATAADAPHPTATSVKYPHGGPFSTIPVGDLVILTGLGDWKGIIRRFDQESGKYVVNDSFGTLHEVAPSALFQNVVVDLRGCNSPRTVGTLQSFQEATGTYRVQYFCHRSSRVNGIRRPEEIIIPKGTVVRLQGLERQTYNGSYGTVVGWAERIEEDGTDTSYYDVQLSKSAVVRVKMANVRV